LTNTQLCKSSTDGYLLRLCLREAGIFAVTVTVSVSKNVLITNKPCEGTAGGTFINSSKIQ